MKTLLYCTTFITILFFTSKKTYSQNANTTLSNLASPTKVNVDLLPNNTNARNLGSSSKSWKNIHANSAYFLGGTKFISNAGLANTFIGSNAGNSNTTGSNNTANGYQALFSNTSGSSNVANGTNALFNNTTGYSNSATGPASLYYNSTGYYNTANGDLALYSNSTGYFNTAIGAQALYGNTTGIYNTATGVFALSHNASNYNTANGAYALSTNTSGTSNTAVGEAALYNNTTGGYNTATGVNALYSNTTGYYNHAFGLNALYVNTTGIDDIAMGVNALFGNSTGSYNTGVGNYTLNNTSSSYYNTAVGYSAGSSYNNGWNNVFVGANTSTNGHDYYNVIAIGQGTVCTDVSQARIGNSATTSIGGYANWTNISDGRVKKNIKQNVPGLAFINKLQPVTYNLDLAAADKIIQRPALKDKDGKVIQPSPQELNARKAKEQVTYTGFVAQDVEKAAKSLNYNFSGVDAAKNEKDLYGLRYAEFVVPLVKAVQELSKQNDSLLQRIEKLETMMSAQSSTATNNAQTINLSSASLDQNIPNPFSHTTTINYTLPQQVSSAKIIITDKSGNVLKEMSVSGAGKGSVQIDASTLSSGTYQYSLVVNGKLISTKQMVLSK